MNTNFNFFYPNKKIEEKYFNLIGIKNIIIKYNFIINKNDINKENISKKDINIVSTILDLIILGINSSNYRKYLEYLDINNNKGLDYSYLLSVFVDGKHFSKHQSFLNSNPYIFKFNILNNDSFNFSDGIMRGKIAKILKKKINKNLLDYKFANYIYSNFYNIKLFFEDFVEYQKKYTDKSYFIKFYFPILYDMLYKDGYKGVYNNIINEINKLIRITLSDTNLLNDFIKLKKDFINIKYIVIIGGQYKHNTIIKKFLI